MTKEAGTCRGWSKESLFQLAVGKLDSHRKKGKLDPFPKSYTKVNSQWIEGLEISLESIKRIKEDIGRTLQGIELRDIIDDLTPLTKKK